MERVTTWWSSLWARWLGWTVAVALVAGACGLAYRALRPGIAPALSLALLVPPLVAAFLIGVRFPSRWWLAGPPVAVLLAGTPLLLILHDVVVPFTQSSMFQDMDMTYATAMFIALLFLLLLMTITLVLFGLVAAAGVWWGKRRAATNIGSTKRSLDGDPSP
jgi:hypothetical protein